MNYQIKFEMHEREKETSVKITVRVIQKPKRTGDTPQSSLRILSPKNNLSTTTHQMDTTRRCTSLSRRENHDHVCDLSHFCLPCTVQAGALRDGEYCHPAFQSRASGKIERIPLRRSSHPIHPRFPRSPIPICPRPSARRRCIFRREKARGNSGTLTPEAGFWTWGWRW